MRRENFAVSRRDRGLSQKGGRDPVSGIPLGNLTSQLFANIYLNELDQFVKHGLKCKYYLRYCDDFVFVTNNEVQLREILPKVDGFLRDKLKLNLHENKIVFRKLKQGIDFLGYVTLPYHVRLRTRTKKRMKKRINRNNRQSYLGLIKHCNGHGLRCSLTVETGSPQRGFD